MTRGKLWIVVDIKLICLTASARTLYKFRPFFDPGVQGKVQGAVALLDRGLGRGTHGYGTRTKVGQ